MTLVGALGLVWVAGLEAQAAMIGASSVYNGDYLAEHGLDGDLRTRWASSAKGEAAEWWQVDFGVVVEVDRVIIHWEVAHALAYEIQFSDDGTAWRTARRQSHGSGGKEDVAGLGGRGRFLRISCLQPGPFGIFSIWEVEFPEPRVAAVLEQMRRAEAQERTRRLEEWVGRFMGSHAGEVVFAARPVVGEHWYANFGYYAAHATHPYFETDALYREGAKLYRLRLGDGRLVELLGDVKGSIRDPQVHYDGTKILFAYRPGGTPCYHLYEINVDGSGLRQLTDGPYDDIEPTYLAEGGIVFVSSRCQRWVNCWTTQVAILYRCDADGGNIRPLSSNNEHDNTPWPLPDGRLLYTRWEYVDRSQVHYHHLWTANPDGTGQAVFFGNLHPGEVMIDAKPIPGSDKVVACFSPGHGQTEHEGRIAVVDPQAGPDAPASTRILTRTAEFRDPWAFAEDGFLAARGRGLVLVNDRGEAHEFFRLPEQDVRAGFLTHEPRPLRTRNRERIVPARHRAGQGTGRFVLVDVYAGRNMRGVKAGEIRKLLVLETLPKPVNFTGGMEPLSYGGTFTLERILGTVPVEPDGSAYFEVPALRSVFFVALDEKELSVKRMQSFTTAMPGEVLGCVGCHEHRTQSPALLSRSGSQPLALARPPSPITPIPDVPDVLDFPRDIQPVLDRHCVACHSPEKPEGGVVLCGDRGPHYSLSYFTLIARSLVADGRNRPISNYPPRALGTSGSRLLAMLDPSHYSVQVAPRERKIVRLWIETGAPYPGTYAALGCGMIGGYEQNHLDRSAADWPASKAAGEAISRRCASCHTGSMTLPGTVCDEIVGPPWQDMSADDPRRRFSRHLLYNLTRPERSLLLLAPLSARAGGLERCGKPVQHPNPGPSGSPPAVFADTADPDYVKILGAITQAKAKLDEIKRFDMPGFRPRPEWVREMKRYGILPANVSAGSVLDVYAVERSYWRSLWCGGQSEIGPP